MASKFSVFVDIGAKVDQSLPSSIRKVESSFAKLTGSLKAKALETKLAFKELSSSMGALGNTMATGGMAFGIGKMMSAGAVLQHETVALRNSGRTLKETAEGIEAAYKTIVSVPGTKLSENLKILNETTAAFGSFEHAVENLEFNAKIGTILQNVLGEKAGDPGEMFNNLVRAFEFRGVAGDAHTYQAEAEKMARAMIFTRGKVNPHEFLNFAQNANPWIKTLSTDFLTKYAPSLIQEYGGDKAGTAFSAFENVITGKARDKTQTNAWLQSGLLDKKMLIMGNGNPIAWKAGAVKDTNLAMSDPLKWAEEVALPAIQKNLGVDINNREELSKTLAVMFRNQMSNRFAQSIMQAADRLRLHKDADLIDQVPSTDKIMKNNQSDPLAGLNALKDSLENLFASATVPLMDSFAHALFSVSGAINELSVMLHNNPDFAKDIAIFTTALGGLVALRLLSIAGNLLGLGSAIGFFAISIPASLASSLISLAGGFVALGGSIGTIVIANIKELAKGLIVVNSIAGGRAALSALALGLGSLSLSVLLFPLKLLRDIGLALLVFIANPIGITITAIVAALASLALWVNNNKDGIFTFFNSFADSFKTNFGPGANSNIEPILSALSAIWKSLNDLLGPLDSSGDKWRSWGLAAGEAAAIIVQKLLSLPESLSVLSASLHEAGAKWISDIKDGAVSKIDELIDWFKTIPERIKAAIGSIDFSNLIKLPSFSFGGAAPAPALAGKRALGGSVLGGRPYLVGENGPEIFVPPSSGRVESNKIYRSLAQIGSLDGGRSYQQSSSIGSASGGSTRSGDTSISITINGAGNDNRELARMVRDEMERYISRAQSVQRGSLSD